MTRTALGAVLARAGIAGGGQRLAYLMMDAELQQVICSGPRQGKQFTYALLEERAPRARALSGDEALAELTRRYVASHGPATARDLAWWSGLKVKQAKTGLDALGREAVSGAVDGVTYWSVPGPSPSVKQTQPVVPRAYLLPNYDELMNALRDRGLFLDAPGPPPPGAFAGLPHQLAIDGALRGAWRPTMAACAVTVAVRPFRPLSRLEKKALESAVARYGTFSGRATELDIV
jgi:hypothetical protein